MVANMRRVKTIQKLKRSVVNGQAQQAHIVGVHHAVAKADSLPLRQHFSGQSGDSGQQGGVTLWSRLNRQQMRKMLCDEMVNQQLQRCGVTVSSEMLQVAETQKTGCHAGHHGGGFQFLAQHAIRRAGQA